MALISGATIIRSASMFHLTLAYFFLTAPHQLAEQNLVFILGEAMGLVGSQSALQSRADMYPAACAHL